MLPELCRRPREMPNLSDDSTGKYESHSMAEDECTGKREAIAEEEPEFQKETRKRGRTCSRTRAYHQRSAKAEREPTVEQQLALVDRNCWMMSVTDSSEKGNPAPD